MTSFILNDSEHTSSLPQGAVVLDLLRSEAGLTGTREGCREGDCGACTVLVGTPTKGGISYCAVNSCILPVGEIGGSHLVTVEGIRSSGGLSVVQEAFVDEGASQCGFCTPGMIMSLTGYLLSTVLPEAEGAVDSLGGNICRCTGYLSVRRAAGRIVDEVGSSPAGIPASEEHIHHLVEKRILPEYFIGIPEMLESQRSHAGEEDSAEAVADEAGRSVRVAGGTDLFATGARELRNASLEFMLGDDSLTAIETGGDWIRLGAAVTVSRLIASGVFAKMGDLEESLGLVSSSQIRNRATLGGNIVNASPIGDLSIMLLALGADVEISGGPGGARRIPLADLFLSYKELDLSEEEIISSIVFRRPGAGTWISFEKVSMRRHLDIASVNSAASFTVDGGTIREASISAGGVAPVPLLLRGTSGMLTGMELSRDTVMRASESAMREVSPIDDVRGSSRYKRALLGRLVKAHFLKLFPDELEQEGLL